MSPRLRALLAMVGIAAAAGASGGLYLVLQIQPGVTVAQLVDAGLGAQCARVLVAVEGICQTVNGPVYRAGQAVGAKCVLPAAGDGLAGDVIRVADSGFALILPDPPGNCEIFRRDGVQMVDGGCGDVNLCDAGTPLGTIVVTPLPCACRAVDGGTCNVTLEDGGTVAAPLRTTLGPGYPWTSPSGAGCIRKSCGELLGFNSMPDGCR